MLSARDKYILEHTSPQGEALDWVEKQTYIRTSYPRMLSGAVQGRFLTEIVKISGARRIMEIGTFTGYSAICLAYGLPEDGHLDSLEIDDELEDLIREGWEKAGVSDRITLHIGDALDTLRSLEGPYDLVYIDANKREYLQYYELCLPLLRSGGVILADDVMLGGKVYADSVPPDKQTCGLVEFNEAVMKDRRVETVMLPLGDGLSMIRKL